MQKHELDDFRGALSDHFGIAVSSVTKGRDLRGFTCLFVQLAQGVDPELCRRFPKSCDDYPVEYVLPKEPAPERLAA